MRKRTNTYDKWAPATTEVITEIIDTATSLLEQHGVDSYTSSAMLDGKDPDMLTATVPIDTSALTRVPGNAPNPQIKINQPVGDFAKEASWSFEINYGMQNECASRHILIMGRVGGIALRAEMSGRPLTDAEAKAIVEDLTKAATA